MSMKHWVILPQKTDDIIEQLLINRNIQDKERFLDPDFTRDLLNPYLIKDMDKAVKRIEKAIKYKEIIGIFADYDADGIPGAAILYKTLQFLKSPVECYIPTRDEGYGLNKKGIDELVRKRCKLLITVDLGIVNKNEAKYAKKLGLDVIITDHHEIFKNLLPNYAIAILHTHLSPKYKNKDLSGAGVAYKLACALLMAIKPSNYENFLKWILDLMAISTICDMVPLTGENRVLTKFGLITLNKTKNLGLKKLYEKAGIVNKIIDPYIVGFLIGPRINAPGRIEDPSASLKLLISNDENTVDNLATELESINKLRREELESALEQARKKILKRKLEKNKIILIEGEKWPLGIIGLVAGKLMEEYYRPIIVFNKDKGLLRGSARSIEKFHILEALDRARAYLTKHGGHARAAGLTLETKHLEILYDVLLFQANRTLNSQDLIPKIKIDMELKNSDINSQLIDRLKQLEPYGLGNPRPVFLSKNFEITRKILMGANKQHLKLILNNKFEALLFNFDDTTNNLSIGDKLDLVYNLDINIWHEKKSIQLKVLDIQKEK